MPEPSFASIDPDASTTSTTGTGAAINIGEAVAGVAPSAVPDDALDDLDSVYDPGPDAAPEPSSPEHAPSSDAPSTPTAAHDTT